MRFLKRLLSPFVSTAPTSVGLLADGNTAYKKGDYAAALRLLLPLANEGDASAQYSVGLMYDKGQGVVQDCTAAMSWYRKAADQAHVSAQFALGAMYFDGTRGVSQDYAQAQEWYLKAAKQGHALAQANLGMMYGNGLGVPRYHDVALMWLILAAEASEDEHHDQIAKWRDTAAKKMTPAQIAQAHKLAREWEGSNGNVDNRPVAAGSYELGCNAAANGDYAMAIRLWSPLADRGEANAQCNIGLLYVNGQSVPQDYAIAAAWLRKAAEQGYAAAQYALGVMYADGKGVPQDSVTAVALFRKAADQGNAGAQYKIGTMYFKGEGLPKDHSTAASWLRKAAEQGDVSAQHMLGTMYHQGGQGVQKDAVAAASWFRKAAEQGYAPAQHLLGAMHSMSLQESVEAYKWLTLAGSCYEPPQEKNRERVLSFRDMVAARMTPAQIAEAQKLAREWKPTPRK